MKCDEALKQDDEVLNFIVSVFHEHQTLYRFNFSLAL
jgi:hypothetical protein